LRQAFWCFAEKHTRIAQAFHSWHGLRPGAEVQRDKAALAVFLTTPENKAIGGNKSGNEVKSN
jgi:hypothetical protein